MATYTTHQEPAANTTYGSDDIFVNCSGSWGGAVYVSWKTKLTLNGSTFVSNTASQGGGALGIARTTLDSTDVLYLNNVSNGRGGAININYSSAIKGGTFSGNRAVTTGGAIFQSKDGYSTLTISNAVQFTGNRAGGDGGAIYQTGTDLATNVTGATFSGNTSGGNGGALYIESNASLTNVTFDGNVAATNGGAVFVGGTANVSVSNTAFLTRSDTIYVDGGTMSWSGTISLAGDVSSTGTINVADGTAIELLLATRTTADGAILDYDALTLAGGASWSVAVDALQTSGNYKLAANGSSIGSITVSAGSAASVTITERDTEYTLGDQKFVLTDDADGNLCLNVKSPLYARTFNGGTIVNSYTAPVISPLPIDTAGANRVEIYEGAILSGSGSGAYIGSNTITCVVTGATFADNIRTGSAGAVGYSNPYFTATDTLFVGNHANGGSNTGGAINYNVNSNDPGKVDLFRCSFTNNFAQGKGGAINVNGGGYSLQVAGGTWSGVEFISNSAGYGGAVAIYDQGRATDIVIDNARFSGNSATGTGGAIKNNSNVSVSNTVFSGNRANTNGGAINNVGTIVLSNSSFETVTDTICNDGGTMNWSGTISLAADVTSTGTINVADGTTIEFLLAPRTAANGAILDYGALTPAGSVSWSATVDANQESGSYKLAANGGAISAVTVSSSADPTASITIDERDTEYTLGQQKFTLTDDADGNLCLNVKSPLYARTFNGGTIVNSYTAPVISPLPIDTAGANRVEIYEGAVLSGSDSRAYTGGNTINCTVTGATFADNINNGAGGAVGGSNLRFDAADSLFVGNTSTANNGGAIWYNVNSTSSGGVNISGSTFADNYAYVYGGAIYTVGTYSSQNPHLVVSDSVFSGNGSSYGGGALFGENRFAGMTVSNTFFSCNTSASGGAIESWGILEVSGSTFAANTASGSGGAIYNRGTATVSDSAFATASDTVHNSGTLTFSGTNTLNTSVTGSGTITVDSGAALVFGNSEAISVSALTFGGNNAMTFNGSAAVNFAADGGQDLSDAAITVDGSVYTGREVIVATGVSAIGGYTVTGADDLTLYTAGGKMVLSEVSNTMSGGTTANFVGGTSNLMTGGTVTVAFFGTRNASGSVRTVFTGGTVSNSMIAGALVKTGESAALDTVSVDIYDGVSLLGGPSNGGMNYVAGYAYGDGAALPGSANYTVSKAVLNLSGSSISGNLYAGAHARKYAYTSVAATTVNVTGGIVEKLYGGGWAERGDKSITGGTAALSTVGTATVNISGGSINRLYAGGGNSYYGYTEVGTANLTISGGTVDFVFLGGRNINCSVGSATLTITDAAQTLTRISGHNDCGAEMTASSTLNVQTNVTLGYLDYVDTINIAENCTLNITELVLYDDISQELSVYLGTDGFDDVWTLLSVGDTTNLDLLSTAQFFVNNTACAMGGSVDIGGDSYRLDKSGLGITLSKIS